jgi:hypothetical protein
MPFSGLAAKGRKQISRTREPPVPGFQKTENQNPGTTAGPTCFENLKEPAVFNKEPAMVLLVYLDLSTRFESYGVIDQNWAFGFLRTMVMNPRNHPDNLHREQIKSVVLEKTASCVPRICV